MICRRSTWDVLALAAVCGLAAACGDSGSGGSSGGDPTATVLSLAVITAATDSDLYIAGRLGAAMFENPTPPTVFLPGCAPFVFEQSLDGVWVFAGPPFVCVWEGIAVDVGEDEFVESDFNVPTDSGFYRLRYDYSTGCEPGLPLSQANCTSELVVHSNEFEITRELCDPAEFGCQFVPGAPNALCADEVNFSGPSGECTLDPASGDCGYEFLSCP